MRFYSLLSKKRNTAAECGKCMMLENNFRGVIRSPRWKDVLQYLELMAANPEEFVTLTLPAPMNGIQYMQACLVGKGVSVQLGLENEGTVTLLEAGCDLEQTRHFFDVFYHNGMVPDVDLFHPMSTVTKTE